MNRMEEYTHLLGELDETPARLNFTVARAKARAKRKKLRRAVAAPLTALSATCAAFVLLVNVSTPFAAACARIPVLKELAAAVSFSPSLTAAVENEWAQSIGQTRSANGIEMTIDYVIVDQKQLNVFYTLEGEPGAVYDVSPKVQGKGEELTGYAIVSHGSLDSGALRCFVVDFTSSEHSMPGGLLLQCKVFAGDRTEKEPEDYAAIFEFDLTFDPQFTEQARIIPVERWLELDGQRVMVKNVEIYPSHIRVNLEDHPNNTAWLRGLELYAEDETGVRYERGGNGISATGSPDSPFWQSFRLESSFFSEGEHLTLYITEARWQNKEEHTAYIDLEQGTARGLPGNTVLQGVERVGDDVTLTFRFPQKEEGNYSGLFSTQMYRDPEGGAHSINSWSVHGAYDKVSMESMEGWISYEFTLKDYPWSAVELELDATHESVLTDPIVIPLS